jgi:Putative beta-barrel porin 2
MAATIASVCNRTSFLAVATVLAAGPAFAEFVPQPPDLGANDVNILHPFVAFQETYDSNLFRLPTGYIGTISSVLPNPSASDYISSGTLGAVGQWELGRQAVNLSARVDENLFAHNDDLNFTSVDASLIWDWRAGSHFSGVLQEIYDRTLTSFGETRFVGKDLVSSNEVLLSGRYQIGPQWAFYGDVRGSAVHHSAEDADYNNFQNRAGDAAVEYATDVDDVFTFKYSYVKLTFPNLSEVSTAPLDYKENAERLFVRYAFTDKTSIDAYAGYLNRNYPTSSFGSYGGDVWHIALKWQATDKTQAVVMAWHDLRAYIDSESDYFVAKGFSITPSWQATEKVNLSLLIQYEDQDYISSSTSVIVAGERHDKVNSGQLTARYTPLNPLTILVNVRRDRRESNQLQFTYNDTLANVSAVYKFR